LKGNLILGLESSNSRMSHLARNELYYGRRYTMEDLISEIDAVTLEDTLRVASRLIREDALLFAGLGPLEENVLPREALRLEG